jgi:type I restriction enzyme S subunit
MKRYDSYKDSGVEWIGEIPRHWNVIKTNILTSNLDGKRIPLNSEQRADIKGTYPYWGSNGIVDYIDKYIFDDEIVLIGEDGSPFFDPNKDVSFYVNEPVWVNNHIHILKTNSKILPKYLSHSFNCVDYREFITGSTRDKLTQSDLKRISHCVPPISEQQQIVDYLDNKTSQIDELIQNKLQKISLLQEYRSTLINKVVTKGLNPNAEMKDSGVEWIGQIPSHYQMISIKFLVTTPVTDGPHETPTFIDEGIPFLSVNGVVGNTIDFNKVRGYISEELHIQYSKKCKPQRDDILLVKSGSTTGKSTIVESDLDFNIWSPLCIIRSNTNKIIPRFTFQTFQSGYFRLLIENNWSYGTQPNIGMEVIENLSIVVPPISEQTEIVSYLDEQTGLIDKKISLEEKRTELLKEYRQSIISEVVTGKIKVI